MKSVAVLQARTSSSRLPGKVLLPINGVPVAILAAKRAANTGRDVIIATSDEWSDDELAEVAQAHGVRCFRGSLNNTLSRVVGALAEYDDGTVVFRLTGDNVFPDGMLLDEIEKDFLSKGVSYMFCNGAPSGLPYGVSAEVTYLRCLREALANTDDPFDTEHVTPYVARAYGRVAFDKYASMEKGYYRCTIDCLDDYLVVLSVFAGVEDIFSISAFELIQRLDGQLYQPIAKKPATKLVLGTAQLGLNYGIANIIGRPSQEVSREIVKVAISNGVPFIDTARAYGEAEKVIGQSLQGGWQGRAGVITKLSPLSDCPVNASADVVNAFVDASIHMSRASLCLQKLDVLMLHRASHFDEWDGAVWHRLLELKELGFIGALGVSVQSPTELMVALEREEVSYIQLPLNVFDWRWKDSVPRILEAKMSRQLDIHVRSAYLQGVILSENAEVWRVANVEDAAGCIKWLSDTMKRFDRRSIQDLCIGYLASLDWVDGIVVGVESIDQLRSNIELFSLDSLTVDQVRTIDETRPLLSECSLNPALWRKNG
ncbi:aldo/keto reductase [Pseudomonas indica]|uniref:aldo/keto reductase n=1 Tax=Pseudomonas indica TaxID=137658 RepID=UPI000BC9581E|nr:aldo/keto reductase [Pseudomonas indica]PAU62158.1 hypothetical protein BZL42_07340 [Pseudomonas indica]